MGDGSGKGAGGTEKLRQVTPSAKREEKGVRKKERKQERGRTWSHVRVRSTFSHPGGEREKIATFLFALPYLHPFFAPPYLSGGAL